MAKPDLRVHRGAPEPDFACPCVGRIVAVSEDGQATVTFAGCEAGAGVQARSALAEPRRAGEVRDSLVGRQVLLLFEDADPERPIVAGLVRETLQPEAVREEVRVDMGKNRDVLVDGTRLVFEAGQEVLLRCGKSSILLKRDGKVVIRGEHLVSRSSGANKIKGSTIALN